MSSRPTLPIDIVSKRKGREEISKKIKDRGKKWNPFVLCNYCWVPGLPWSVDIGENRFPECGVLKAAVKAVAIVRMFALTESQSKHQRWHSSNPQGCRISNSFTWFRTR